MIVYVVAWEHYEGGGFDWYFRAEDADAAYAEEKAACEEFADYDWTAYRFDFSTELTDRQQITQAICTDLIELCRTAPIKHKAGWNHSSTQ